MAKAVKKIKKEKNIVTQERYPVDNVSLAAIKPNDYNPNRQNDREFFMLCKSIDEDGFTMPIVVHKESRQIIDGEHRWTAVTTLSYMRKHEIKLTEKNCADVRSKRDKIVGELADITIPATLASMTPEQMRIATLRHNRARGSEQVDLTAQVLKDLEAMGAFEHAADSLLIDEDEMRRMIDETTAAADLAAEEFGEAWSPGGSNYETSAMEGSTQEGNAHLSMSSAANLTVREREVAVQKAKTEEERQAILSDSRTHKLVLMLTEEQMNKARVVLGFEMADKLLTWIESEYEKLEKHKEAEAKKAGEEPTKPKRTRK